MNTKQHTLKKAISFQGKGLHSGKPVNLTIEPAPIDHGFIFQRIDLEGQPTIPADADLVTETRRGTTLEKNGASVCTTEHVLAALYGMQVDNALIKVDNEEMPIMDGSAIDFVNGIVKAGLETQDADRVFFEFKENQPFEDLEKGVELLAIPYDDFRVTVMVDYDSVALGTQHASMYEISEFQKEIAPCRTFVFLRELEMLAKAGLIKGGEVDNAIVLVERENVPQEEIDSLAKLLGKEHLDIKIKGKTLNNVELKFLNEPARHKLLDIIGDLALVGMPIKGHILGARPGHSGNTSFAKIIKGIIKDRKKKKVRNFDLTQEPVYDINAIEKMLPHRYPFLLVDKVIEMTEEKIVGVKNITMNEPQFTGHFPGNPVMPGVLQIESMAQVGGIFSLSKVDEPELYTTYFLKIDNVKFKKKVIPGDTLVFELKLMSPMRRGLVQMAGVAYVDGLPVMEAEMLAQVIKDKG